MYEVYSGLEPAELWRHFDALNRIPRPSGGEAAAIQYVRGVAAAAGCQSRTDDYGNCVVYVPARNGSTPPLLGAGGPVCVQAHVDMVKATAPGVVFDFDRDAIVPRRDGDRIMATGTTLGADNGIGAAACLALITSPDLSVGPLELLFTVEEETGLRGASALDGSLLTSNALINLDSEDLETLTVGCAGGETTHVTLPYKPTSVPDGWVTQEIRLGGLLGGHSGVEIHKNRANAIQVLSKILSETLYAGIDYRIAYFSGGSAHNAIPRDAIARVCVPSPEGLSAVVGRADQLANAGETWGEPGLELTIRQTERAETALTSEDTGRLIGFLTGIPTGVRKMSDVFEGKVQTSDNLATVSMTGDRIEIVVSLRSFVAREIDEVRTEVARLAAKAGGALTVSSAYPSWEPNPSSNLLKVTTAAFEQIIGASPIGEVVHAGLECGVISAKVPGMEAISFGPRIEGPHTPEECVYPETVATTWKLLIEILQRLSA